MAILKDGPIRRRLREKGLLGQRILGATNVLEEVYADVSAIDRFIRDEESDVRKYQSAYSYLKTPDAKMLAAQLAMEEGRHAAAWKNIKTKLEKSG